MTSLRGIGICPAGLTNDCVVVPGEFSGLDFGFELHRILLSSQQPHEVLFPRCCDNLRPKPCVLRSGIRDGQPPAGLQLPPTGRSRRSHNLGGLRGLRRDRAGGEGGRRGSMNRDVVVGSDLACPDLSFELHSRSPSRSALLSVTAQSRRQNLSSELKIFSGCEETPLSSRIFNHFQLTSETAMATLCSQSASPPKG